jgi:radical SAM superfamily enzyme YgiQ (UPF0313 family)
MTQPQDLIYLAHMPQWNISQPPMGISYIASYLNARGIKTMISDFSIEMYHALPTDKKFIMDSGDFHINWISTESYNREIQSIISPYLLKYALQILKSKAKIIGFSVLSTNILPTLNLIRILKQKRPELTIILGGPLVTRYEGAPWVIEQVGVDFIIPDEGEETCLELIQALQQNKTNFEDIKGLIYKNNLEVIDTGKRELISNINEIPYPNYQFFPLEKYKDYKIPLLGSRGCIFKCSFCSETILWKRYRFRSAENIIDEMKHHIKNYQNRYFYIVDSLINGNMKELISMCEMIIDQGLEVKWGGKASVRIQMSKEIIELMAKAGCTDLQYGIESGSPKVVRDMRKGFTIPIAKQVLKDTYDAGIQTSCFFLIGFPTESEKNYQETKSFLNEIQHYIHEIIPGYGMGLQPGSEVFEDPKKFGIEFLENGGWYSPEINGDILENRVKDFRNFCKTLDVEIGG